MSCGTSSFLTAHYPTLLIFVCNNTLPRGGMMMVSTLAEKNFIWRGRFSLKKVSAEKPVWDWLQLLVLLVYYHQGWWQSWLCHHQAGELCCIQLWDHGILLTYHTFLAVQDSSITDIVGPLVPWSQLTIRNAINNWNKYYCCQGDKYTWQNNQSLQSIKEWP